MGTRRKADGLSKYEQFFQHAYATINKPFLHFQRFSLGEETISMLSQTEINQFNQIELELFELCKSIKTNLSKSDEHQLKLWILKIKSITEEIQKLCKSLKVSFISGLFQKIVLCLTILIYLWNNSLNNIKSEQKDKEPIKPSKGSKDGSTQTVKFYEQAKEDHPQFTKLLAKKGYANRDPAYKIKMGGVSLYNQSYRRNLDIKSLLADLFDNNPVEKEKKMWVSDMKKCLASAKQNQDPIDEHPKLAEIVPGSEILKTMISNESDSFRQLKIFDHQFTMNNFSGEEFEYVVRSLESTYLTEKTKILFAVKKLFERFLLSEREKMNKVESELTTAKKQIGRLQQILFLEHKQHRTLSTQTMPCRQLALLTSQNKKLQQQLRMHNNILASLNDTIKQQNQSLMNFQKRMIENQRKQKQLLNVVKEKGRLFHDTLVKQKKKKDLLQHKIQKMKKEIIELTAKKTKKKTIVGETEVENEVKNSFFYENSMKILSVKEEKEGQEFSELNFSKCSQNFTRRFINTSHYIPDQQKKVTEPNAVEEEKKQFANVGAKNVSEVRLKFTKSQKVIRQNFSLFNGQYGKAQNKQIAMGQNLEASRKSGRKTYKINKTDHIQEQSHFPQPQLTPISNHLIFEVPKNNERVRFEEFKRQQVNTNENVKGNSYKLKIHSQQICLLISGSKGESNLEPKKKHFSSKAFAQSIKNNATDRMNIEKRPKHVEIHQKGVSQQSSRNHKLNKPSSNKSSHVLSNTSLQNSNKKSTSFFLKNCSSETLQFPSVPKSKADKIKEKLKKYSNANYRSNEIKFEHNSTNVNKSTIPESSKTAHQLKIEEIQQNVSGDLAVDTINEHSQTNVSKINSSFNTDRHKQSHDNRHLSEKKTPIFKNVNSSYEIVSSKNNVLKKSCALASQQNLAEQLSRERLKTQNYLNKRRMLKACTVSIGGTEELSLSLMKSFYQAQENIKREDD